VAAATTRHALGLTLGSLTARKYNPWATGGPG
jgi:hypothetical protein